MRPIPLIDTHCHVHFNAYKDDMDEVILRSLDEGVFMITVGTQSSTSRSAVEAAERHDGVWAAVGLHPNHTCEQEFSDEDELPALATVKTRCETFDPDYFRGLARHPKVVAIGECGLDYYRLPENIDRDEAAARQIEAVRLQFDLADELNLPLIIHCREAHREQQEMIRGYVKAGRLKRRGVAHCFTGTLEEARGYLDLGFMISFTGIITFPPRKGEGEIPSLHRVIRDLPLEAILVETDAPYLSPVPRRGERNEPRYVRHIAKKIAEIKQTTPEEVARATTENARRLFNLSF